MIPEPENAHGKRVHNIDGRNRLVTEITYIITFYIVWTEISEPMSGEL